MKDYFFGVIMVRRDVHQFSRVMFCDYFAGCYELASWKYSSS